MYENFIYLGRLFSEDSGTPKDMKARLARAQNVFETCGHPSNIA